MESTEISGIEVSKAARYELRLAISEITIISMLVIMIFVM